MNFERVIAVRKNKTIYLDGDKVYKVFDKSYSKADVLNEALNQARVEETGLNIPKMLEVTMIDGQWALVSEYIPGKTLAVLMEENPDNIDMYLDMFVELQLAMHEKRCPKLNKLRDKMNAKISEANITATTRYDLHTRLDGMLKHYKLCHGDFNPSNIIVTDKGKPYILDWSHATQGNSSADAARTYLLFCLADQAEIGDKYLDLFCLKSGTAKQYIQSWMPIVAASQSVKGNEQEREFLARWFDVVDYV